MLQTLLQLDKSRLGDYYKTQKLNYRSSQHYYVHVLILNKIIYQKSHSTDWNCNVVGTGVLAGEEYVSYAVPGIVECFRYSLYPILKVKTDWMTCNSKVRSHFGPVVRPSC